MVGSPRRRRAARVVSVLLVAGVVAGLAGGCSGDSEPSDAASSPSASATDVSDLAPVDPPVLSPKAPRPPPARDTAASRRAFTRYVIASWRHALLTNDATAVTGIAGPSGCRGCPDLRAELRDRSREGWYVDLPPITVRRIELVELARPRQWLAEARVDIPASTSYFEEGVQRNTNRSRRNVGFHVIMEMRAQRYLLRGYFLT